jgi:hypothetical protein
MNLFQILLLIFIVYLVTYILFIFAFPTTKKPVDSSIAKGLKVSAPPKKRGYFGIDYFSSGWDEAKQSPKKFILFIILSPLIFISWLLWIFFRREIPRDFKRVFPSPHGGGRPTGKKTYPQDEKALRMVLEEGMTIRQVWGIMRPEYYTDEYWSTLDKIERERELDNFRKRIENAINNLDNNF